MAALFGMSPETKARKAGAAGEPVVGPANTKCAVWVTKLSVIVPDEVMGDPETEVSPEMAANATDVTVPAPEADVQFWALPLASMPSG